MNNEALRAEIRRFLRFEVPTEKVQFDTCEVVSEVDYDRILIRYQNEESARIPAFLLCRTEQAHFLRYSCITSTMDSDTSGRVKSAAWWVIRFRRSGQLWPGGAFSFWLPIRFALKTVARIDRESKRMPMQIGGNITTRCVIDSSEVTR
jgi:hypothetical protein